jgi:glutathione-independent formaldehyde dehydrogenase
MSRNRSVVYIKPGVVEVQDIADPKFADPHGRKINHAVILKIVSNNICRSDQHMVRGRTTAPPCLVLGHEITGEVIEKGADVKFLDIGGIVSVPFNIACGRCRTCRAGDTGVCPTVNPGLPGRAYGYVDMGGWTGGQPRYVMTPYADFNLLKYPDKSQALARIRNLTMLTDILPTGFQASQGAGRRLFDGLYRRLRAVRAGCGDVRAHSRRGSSDDRQHQSRTPCAREEGQLPADGSQRS